MQQIGVNRERRVATLVLGNRNLVLLGKFDQPGSRGQIPLPPWCNHRHIRFERVICQFEPDLIVALAGSTVCHGIGSHLIRNLDLLPGDQRPRD